MSRKYIIGALLLLVYLKGFSNTELIDPVTKKIISYHTISIHEKLNRLNPFEDIDLSVPVLTNNQKVNESIKSYMKNILVDEDYINRFKDHYQQAVASFVRYSADARGFSSYDMSSIAAQNVVLEDLDGKIMYYYNNLLCVQLESQYKINRTYDQFAEGAAMYEQIFVDVNTGKISTMMNLCPQPLRKSFIAMLTRERNNVVPVVNKQTIIDNIDDENDDDDDESEEHDEDQEYESPNGFPLQATAKEIEEQLNKTKIITSDLIFDVNAFNFFVQKNGFNTLYSRGESYILFISEDSINHYLPWTINKFRGRFSVKADVKKINKNLMMYTQEYNFLNEQLKKNFKDTKNKGTVTLLYRQKSLNDTTFKVQQRLRFGPDNMLMEVESDFSSTGDKPNSFKKYYYDNDKLSKIELTDDGKKTEYAKYVYDQKGLILRYTSTSSNDSRDHYYSYSDMSVSDCSADRNGSDCYSYVFDSAGNMVSHSYKGQITKYQRIYRNNLLMADGDALYSYNSDGQLESVERDRGRYYSNYFYDNKKRLVMLIQYDTKMMTQKELFGYDDKGRLASMKKITASYGTVQTELDYKLIYE